VKKIAFLLSVVILTASSKAQTSDELWRQGDKLSRAVSDIGSIRGSLSQSEALIADHAVSIASSIETYAKLLSLERGSESAKFTGSYLARCRLVNRGVVFHRIFLMVLIERSTMPALNGELRSLRDGMDELKELIAPAVKEMDRLYPE